MNETSEIKTPDGGLVTAIGVLVLLIGGAMNNALWLLAMSVTALVVMAIFHRQLFGPKATLVTILAVVVAMVVGFVATTT